MGHWFELWESSSANLVGTYDTRADALAIVRRSLADHGHEAVSSLVLTREVEDGEPEIIASGDELIALACGSKTKMVRT